MINIYLFLTELLGDLQKGKCHCQRVGGKLRFKIINFIYLFCSDAGRCKKLEVSVVKGGQNLVGIGLTDLPNMGVGWI